VLTMRIVNRKLLRVKVWKRSDESTERWGYVNVMVQEMGHAKPRWETVRMVCEEQRRKRDGNVKARGLDNKVNESPIL
jgi:hypothetical protein